MSGRVPMTSGRRLNVWRFHRGKITIWVEDQYDSAFWWEFLKRFIEPSSINFERARDRKILEQVATEIEEQSIPIIVVMDGDYDILINPDMDDRRILRARRYGIENYLFAANIIDDLARQLCRAPTAQIAIGATWEQTLEELLEELLILDLAKELCPHPRPKVIGAQDGCTTLLQEGSWVPCRDKLKEKVRPLQIPEKAIKRAEELLSGQRIIHFLKGHFVAASLVRFLNEACQAFAATCAQENGEDPVAVPTVTEKELFDRLLPVLAGYLAEDVELMGMRDDVEAAIGAARSHL